jgi:TPR repeat protein
MSAMKRTTYRGSQGSNAWTFEESQSGSQHVTYRFGSYSSSDNSIPLSLSDLREPDPRKFACLATSQLASILARIFGLAVSVIAIFAAALNSDASSALIDKSKLFISGTIGERLAAHAASTNAGAPRSEASTEAVVNADHTVLHSQVPAVLTGNRTASETLDAETLAPLTIRAKNLLGLGDIAGARLLLERVANAQDAAAALLLAQTHDPTVLGVRDTRSVTPDPELARDWYRKAAGFGSADAQQRLTQLQN